MGKLVYFIMRIVWVLFHYLIFYPFLYGVILIVGTIWTFKPKERWKDCVQLWSEPFHEESIYYSTYVETYWVMETPWDYILRRKVWKFNPLYIPENKRNQKTGKMISKDEVIRVIELL